MAAGVALWAQCVSFFQAIVKRLTKKRLARPERTVKPKVERLDEEAGFRLEQPIQTALYAKLYRLGYYA